MSSWVYIESERFEGNVLYTVGFYSPDGRWHPEFDGSKEECAARVAWLNGAATCAANSAGVQSVPVADAKARGVEE